MANSLGSNQDVRSNQDEEEEGEVVPQMLENAVAPQRSVNQAEETEHRTATEAISVPRESVAIEQIEQGSGPGPQIVASFDGLGEGFDGPQGTATLRNPSDNSLAIGPNHIVQIVNTRMAVFTKKGSKFDSTGKVLYGPVATGNVFKGFFGPGVELNNGDAVVRYDQLAGRWLIVMPIFRRLPPKGDEVAPPKSGEPAHRSGKA